MNIILYNTSSEKNRIDKVLSEAIEKNGTLKEECSVMKPRILVTGDIFNRNYLYIPDFKLYYFIIDIISIRKGLSEIICEVDPLFSYSDQIKNLFVTISKQENLKYSNLYIDDGSWKTENRTVQQSIEFQSGFDNEGSFVLITAGA